jgi:L-seryl-tRNA(Ser) seleniumtransferase
MVRLSQEAIGGRAEAIANQVQSEDLNIEVIEGESVIGGGAAPSAVLPTKLLAITSKTLGAEEVSQRLRKSKPPIIARIEEGRVLLDLRTVFPEQDAMLRDALGNCS